MSKAFPKDIDKNFDVSDVSFSSAFLCYRGFRCFSAMGVQKKSCRKAIANKTTQKSKKCGSARACGRSRAPDPLRSWSSGHLQCRPFWCLVYWATTAGPLGPPGNWGATCGSFFAGYRHPKRVKELAVRSHQLTFARSAIFRRVWRSWLPMGKVTCPRLERAWSSQSRRCLRKAVAVVCRSDV
jgi:hypothetical protein